jgi:hypothetical protein
MIVSESGLAKIKASVTEKIFFGQEPTTELILSYWSISFKEFWDWRG